ncbi:sulfatase-like hydrolase/transferase [bacterium]|nr:sulfatase-like hydrolase/transferase [bacterium]
MKKLLLAALIFLLSMAEGLAQQPNIILMLADDLGYGDLSSYNPNSEGNEPNNTPIRTPILNDMAKNGVRFTDFHSAAPICSPSRRALLTARYPNRLGEWAEAYRSSPDGVVAFEDPTIGTWLNTAGYATAVYGKWNVGEVKGVSWPGAHGFDDWLIIDHNTGYFQHQNKNKDCLNRPMLFETGGNRVSDLEGRYLTNIWTDKALEFIAENKSKPFFLYLPWSIPHAPLQAPTSAPTTAFDAGAKSHTPEGREAYVTMVEHLDSQIGRIFATLKKQEQLENTLIIFTSDNGGMLSGNCWPLKKSKQHLEEGGIRVPMLMQWPGRISAGTVSDQPSIMMDASVTLLAAADALKHVPKDRVLDGINLLENSDTKREFGWRRRDWGAQGNYLRQEAFRSGDWKLLRTFKHLGNKQWSAEYKDELFNLKNDLGETKNLVEQRPEKYAVMKTAFNEWKREVVELEPKYLISLRDQLGSPANLPDDIVMDFKSTEFIGKIHKAKTKELVSDPVNENGVCRVFVKANATPPLLHTGMEVDTEKYSKLRFEMKITGGATVGAGRVVLRHTGWKGEDVHFRPIADGKWHEYVIDCTNSAAWSQWTPQGRIGVALPVPTNGEIKVELKTIQLVPERIRDAQSIQPTKEQTSIKWGHVGEENSVRKVVSTEAEYNSHNRHGPKTFYHVPFTNGTFSLSWKRDLPQKMNLVFETVENGKPTHLFKVFVNGTPNKDITKTDIISCVTYEKIPGSKKLKAKVKTKKYHAEAGKWHTTSVTFNDNVVTIRVDDVEFSVEDDRLRNKVTQCGVGHIWGTLETKDVTITKN